MTRPALLLFDLGGVLLHNAGYERLKALLPPGLDAGQIRDRLLSSPAFREFEQGHSTPETFARHAVDELGLDCSPGDFLADFATWPQGLYPGVPPLLARLRTRYTVACLSNSNAVHWQQFGDILRHFDVALSSHILGAAKPDRACFLLALQHCRVQARDVLFFDDALANVEAARACGISAVHVRNFADVMEQADRLLEPDPADNLPTP